MDGIYHSLSGAITLEQRLQIVANDLANLNTAGHKRTRIAAGSTYPNGGEVAATSETEQFGDEIFSQVVTQQIDFSQGQLRMTGSPTDIALEGSGFLTVDVDGETFYTRAGQFELDAAGRLVTRVEERWAPVLGSGGQPLTVGSQEIRISESGEITAEDGSVAGTLGVVDFANPQLLVRAGSALYRNPTDAAGLIDGRSDATRVRQGALEMSNADPISCLVEMIEIQRAHQAIAKAMMTVDEATSRRTSLTMSS
ncbi:flagellar basal-body rod protein FlgF [Candidatus Sumerlaeota bacterium]|nr:flagellar basal-body rod protein FlgF [Candidatus Sumerlaeota bacterium]